MSGKKRQTECVTSWVRWVTKPGSDHSTFSGLQNGLATVEAPNRFFRDWVHDRYHDLMCKSLAAEVGDQVEVKLTVGKEVNGNGHGNGHTNGHTCKDGTARPVVAAALQASPNGVDCIRS